MSRDTRTESLLKRGGYKFEYKAKVPFLDIDIKGSKENPARLHRKINDYNVCKYALDMVAGADFPALVLMRRDKAKFLVGTGMHRIEAVTYAGDDLPEAKRNCFDAYIVTEADQFEFELLIRLLNGIEGQGDSQEDQLFHVISLHERFPNKSLGDLAKRFGLKEATAVSAWNYALGVKRGSRLGFEFERDKLPQNTVIALNRIPSDIVFTAAAEYVIHYEIIGRDTEDLVKELKDIRHQGQDAEIEVIKKRREASEQTKRRDKSRGKKSTASVCTRFIGSIRAINRQVARGVDPLKLNALPDLEDAIAVVDDAIENLPKVLAELLRIRRLNTAGHPSHPDHPTATH